MRRGIKSAIEFCHPNMTGQIKQLILDAIYDEFTFEQLKALGTLLNNPFQDSEIDAAFGDLYPLFEYGLVTHAVFKGDSSVDKKWVVVTVKGKNFYDVIVNYLPHDHV